MEYVGDIPEGWKWVKLGEIAEIKAGKTNTQDIDNTGDYPFFDRSSVIKKSKKFLFDMEAIIIPGEGKEFIPRYYNGRFDLHQRSYAIFNFKSCIPKFVYYSILANRDIFKSIAVGSTVLSLRLDHILNFPILLPPIKEQSAIVDILSSIHNNVELILAQNKTSELMAMTLFRQWFIEPTRDGLPDGWEEKKLKDIYVFEKGIEPGSKNYLETPSVDAIRFIRVGDMLDNKANVYSELPHLIEGGDFLL
jgi:type I restriction enzyme S subunit